MTDVAALVGLVASLLFIWEKVAEYRKKRRAK